MKLEVNDGGGPEAGGTVGYDNSIEMREYRALSLSLFRCSMKFQALQSALFPRQLNLFDISAAITLQHRFRARA